MYRHLVQYYETDKMGITHHSNYIRFMEEARLDFFNKNGINYLDFEKQGIASPVVGLNNIRYKKPSTVGDVIDIDVAIKSMNNVFFTMQYVMRINETIIFTGESEHCLISKAGKILPLTDPAIEKTYKIFLALLENKE